MVANHDNTSCCSSITQLILARPVHVNSAQEVLSNHSSTSILTSSLMINSNSFLVVTNTHTTTVSRAEFKLLMESLNIRLDIQDSDSVQSLFVTKNLGKILYVPHFKTALDCSSSAKRKSSSTQSKHHITICLFHMFLNK